jgi:hypothetical protein
MQMEKPQKRSDPTRVPLYATTMVLLGFAWYKSKRNTLNIASVMIACFAILLAFIKRKPIEPYSDLAEDIIINNDFVEPFYQTEADTESLLELKRGLGYYVSSFNMHLIDLTTDIVKMKLKGNTQNAAIVEEKLIHSSFNQYNGFHISMPVMCLSCDKIFKSYRSFSIFTYMKLGVTQYHSEKLNKYTMWTIYATSNFNDSFWGGSYMSLIFTYRPNQLNPDISLVTCGDQKHTPLFVADVQNDYKNNILLTNHVYHSYMITVKDYSTVTLYIDGVEVGGCSVDKPNCISCTPSVSTFNSMNKEEVFQSMLPSVTNMKINPSVNRNEFNMEMTNFGIYPSRTLSKSNAINLHKYFESTRNMLSPEMQQLYKEKQAAQKIVDQISTTCPYDDVVCNSEECKLVHDWRNVDDLTRNPKCFKQVSNYCDKNAEQSPVGCTFTSKKSVFQMANAIDPNLHAYGYPSAVTDEKLDKMRDIYIDKSLDTKGRNHEAFKKVVEDLVQDTRPMDIVEEVGETVDTISPISYEDLQETTKSIRQSTPFATIYNNLIAKHTKKKEGFEQIDEEILEEENIEEEADVLGTMTMYDKLKTGLYEALLKTYHNS